MTTRLTADEVTQQLPVLLDEIAKRPEHRFYITVDDRIVAEMRAVRSKAAPGDTGRKLISAAKMLSTPGDGKHATARDHDDYLCLARNRLARQIRKQKRHLF